jgi:hypothetical protein
MTRLYNIVKGADGATESGQRQMLEDYVRVLGESPGATFAGIERVHGTWHERLQRYLDDEMLRLDEMGPELSDLLADSEEIVRRINTILIERRRDFSINVLKDSAALTTLRNLVQSWEDGETNILVRFYTETKALRSSILGNADLRTMLAYRNMPNEGVSPTSGSGLVLRDNDYLILRAWFEELCFGPQDGGPAVLSELNHLSETLSAILSRPSWYLERAMDEIEHDGQPLGLLLQDFESLGIMHSVWTRGRIPQSFLDLKVLRRWTRVMEFASGRNASEMVFSEFRGVQSKLESQLETMRALTRDIELITRSAERRQHRVRGHIIDAMRDLGLVRWGYTFNEAEQEKVVTTLNLLFQEDARYVAVEASKVALLMEQARHDPNQCSAVCAILWALRCYAAIVRLVEDCALNVGREALPPNLVVIQVAAEAKSGKVTDHHARKQTIDSIWQFSLDVPPDRRAGILLGVGYVLYQAWRAERIESDCEPFDPTALTEEVNDWARRSLAVGEQAYNTLERNGLAWAFALNHCAYIAVVTQIAPDKTSSLIRRLLTLENNERVWNARFADTVGTYHLMEAERAWFLRPSEDRKSLDLDQSLDLSQEYLSQAKAMDIGDGEVDEHLNRLAMVRHSYETARNQPGQTG